MVPHPQEAPNEGGSETNGIENGNTVVAVSSNSESNALVAAKGTSQGGSHPANGGGVTSPATAAIASAAALATAAASAAAMSATQQQPQRIQPQPMQQQPPQNGGGAQHQQAVTSTAAAAPPTTMHYAYPTPGLPQQHPSLSAAAAAAALPVYHAPPASSHTSNVFQHMKLRRGKWTNEEEEYAALLIAEFEKGTISGVDNGCTLRAFLAKKLHCAPMRISKKYAGKSIGKHVFLSRKTGHGMHGAEEESAPDGDNGAKLRELELKFYKSLFQEVGGRSSLHMSAPPFALAPYLSQTGLTSRAGGGALPPSSLFNQTMQYTPTGAYVAYGAGIAPPATNSTTLWPATTSSASNQTKANPPVPPNDQTKLLHQSYLIALNQMQLNNAATPPPSQPDQAPIAPKTTSPHPPTSTNGTNHPGHPKPPAPAGKSSKVAPASTAQVNATPAPPAPSTTSVQPASESAVVQSTKGVSSNASGTSNFAYHAYAGGPADIPDLLAGFERVAANAAKANVGPPSHLEAGPWTFDGVFGNLDTSLLATQYSPPFTSRSFDDLHQFLGKDLSQQPLDLNAKSSSPPQAPRAVDTQNVNSNVVQPGPGPAAAGASSVVSAADAYAMFAQESALAVSQHSAYCRTDDIPGGPETSPATNKAKSTLPAPTPAAGDGNVGSPAVILDEDSTCKLNHHRSSTSNHHRSHQRHLSSSVVNAANLRAHAKAAEQTGDSSSSDSSRSKRKSRRGLSQSFMRRHPNIISGSERSSSDIGTEESYSALSSSRGSGSESADPSESTDPSDNTSNDSDSNSDGGPCRKKAKSCREEASRDGLEISTTNQETLSPASERSSPQMQ